MVYLFIGQDYLSKGAKLKKIKEELLAGGLPDFNADILYAKELHLRNLQEIILYLPFKSQKRIVIIKGIQDLKKEVQEFLLEYLKRPEPKIILILDADYYEPKDEFMNQVARRAQVLRFKEPAAINTFTLSRKIGSGRAGEALKVLNQLLENSEKPERILGGLRYAKEKEMRSPQELRKQLKALLNCDIDIKTGRLKPEFALERLVVRLCGFVQPFH